MWVQPRSELEKAKEAPNYVREIAMDMILTLLTCGIWNFWVQARQMRAVNFMIGQDKYHFVPWLLLTLVTCGLWHIYHEYRLSDDIMLAQGKTESNKPIAHLVLSLFGLSIITDALQQAEINAYFGQHSL